LNKLTSLHRIRLFAYKFQRIFILAGIAILLFGWISYIDNDLKHPQHYHLTKLKAANGVLLYTIRTNADNVRLQQIDTNVTGTSYYGVNGGFFWEGSLLSMAVIDHEPLIGLPGEYGSGWYNWSDGTFKRGTLVWDGLMKRFSVQVVGKADELLMTDIRHYWAQGGVSMSLGNESGWKNQMIREQMPSYDEGHMRTGLVYDEQQFLYMIVTPTSCTIEQFRSAILEKLGSRKLVDGIFLDGDGSSQMQAREARLVGDHRQVYQMLTLKK
jgi:hypothetical protein